MQAMREIVCAFLLFYCTLSCAKTPFIDEIENGRYVSGEKIVLSERNSAVLLEKALRDFDLLKFSNFAKKITVTKKKKKN